MHIFSACEYSLWCLGSETYYNHFHQYIMWLVRKVLSSKFVSSSIMKLINWDNVSLLFKTTNHNIYWTRLWRQFPPFLSNFYLLTNNDLINTKAQWHHTNKKYKWVLKVVCTKCQISLTDPVPTDYIQSWYVI